MVHKVQQRIGSRRSYLSSQDCFVVLECECEDTNYVGGIFNGSPNYEAL